MGFEGDRAIWLGILDILVYSVRIRSFLWIIIFMVCYYKFFMAVKAVT